MDSRPGDTDAFGIPLNDGEPNRRRTAGRVQAKPSAATNTNITIVAYIVPALIYGLLMMFFTYVYYHNPLLVWTLTIICALFAGTVFVAGQSSDNVVYQFFGALCVFAVIVAIATGLSNYRWYTRPANILHESHEYFNVLPSEPAAAHADAGKIFFAENARVDSTKSVGYKSGHIYCVAPILDEYAGSKVEYWAVGMDCCGQRSEFTCDAAADTGVWGGVVVQDSSFLWGKSNFDHYHLAVKQAEAAFDLVSAKEILFIRWVENPEAIEHEMLTTGGSWCFIWIGIYAIFNAFFTHISTTYWFSGAKI